MVNIVISEKQISAEIQTKVLGWVENDYAQRRAEGSTVWHSLGIYEGDDGATEVHMKESKLDTAPPPGQKNIDSPLPLFLTHMLALTSEDARQILEGLGYRIGDPEHLEDGSMHIRIDTPTLHAVNEVLDDIRDRTGFALEVREYTDKGAGQGSIPSKDSTIGLGKGTLFVGSTARFRAHDMITHAPILLLFPESTIGRMAAKSSQTVLDKEQKQWLLPNRRAQQRHTKHFEAIEETATYLTLAEALEHAESNLEEGITYLAEALPNICFFSEGERGRQEARQEAMAIFDRVQEVRTVLATRN